jgi:hypothetical protein
MLSHITKTFLLLMLSTFQYTAVAQSLSKADEDFVDKCVEKLIQAERKLGGTVMGSMIQTWRNGDCMTELKNKKSSTVSSNSAGSKSTQWTYVGTYTDTKWVIDTASIKYETPTLISFQIKGGSGSHFHMKLNCANQTMSQAYQPFQSVPNTNNVVAALLNSLCFPMK